MDYINVIFERLPLSVKGVVVRNSDGGHTIIINSMLSREQQERTYLHELSHIRNKDYSYIYNVNELETERHAGD